MEYSERFRTTSAPPWLRGPPYPRYGGGIKLFRWAGKMVYWIWFWKIHSGAPTAHPPNQPTNQPAYQLTDQLAHQSTIPNQDVSRSLPAGSLGFLTPEEELAAKEALELEEASADAE
jgi:hypothetical protein